MEGIRQAAFDFIDRVSSISEPDQVVAELQKTGELFGFENFCMSGLPTPGEKLDPYILLSGWPEGWLHRYLEEDYVQVDPVCRRLLSASMPFAWSEAPYDPDDAAAARVMNEAPDFGLHEGFAVPIYTTHGFQAAVTFSARRLDLDREMRGGLHLVAIYAHNKVRSLLGSRRTRPAPHLSPRETECLKWASVGKSSWDISVLLNISERTVDQYFAAASAKLNTVNRTQAVAEALRMKLIR